MWAKYAIYEAIDKIPEICRCLYIQNGQNGHYGASYESVLLHRYD